MATVQIKGHLLAYHFDHMDEGTVHWSFSILHDNKNASPSTVMAIPHTFTAEVPDQVDIVAGLVKTLEAAKLKALADYQRTVAEINERLSKLQAIAHEA